MFRIIDFYWEFYFKNNNNYIKSIILFIEPQYL